MRPQSESQYRVQVRKWDGRAHYTWATHLLESSSDFIWVACPGPRDLVHQTKGQTFRFNTHAMEWFWPGAWFSIGVSLEVDTRKTKFYCNLHQPLVFVEGALEFVDLDIDVVREGNSPSLLVDLDEFEIHGNEFNYPDVIKNELPGYGERLAKAIDDEELFRSEELGELFDQVMVRGGPSLNDVNSEVFDRLRFWPERVGPGLDPLRERS
jgi:uncharacterized protein